MNFLERIDAVLHGQEPDQVPYAPYHNLVPRGDFERELGERGMGLVVRLGRNRIWTETPNVEIETKTAGSVVTTTYHTPKGDVWTQSRTHLGRISGSMAVRTEGLIKSVEDFDPVIFMVEDTVYHVDNSVYFDTVRDLGTYGLVRGSGLRTPYPATRGYFGSYSGIPAWVYAQQDYPDHFAKLMDALERQQERLFPLVASSPAENVAFGSLDGHYGPQRWEKYILPFYKKYVPRLHAEGKICHFHAHASNITAYKDLIRESGVDVVEAFTPPPVGDLSIAEARKAWGPDTVIWVNFPETIFYYGAEETKRYTIDLLESDPPGNRLVIGFTEMGTYGIQDAQSERLFKDGFRAIMEVLEEYGNYPIG
jgi:hypothetical protein